ncbi:MAG: class IV lanthionine synthetase LanL [Egibacteraceae bacterium]
MDSLSFLEPLQRGRLNGHDSTLVDLVRAAVERDRAGAWEVRLDGMWCAAQPPAHNVRDQGWKLHVAASRSSAPAVLERSLDVLIGHRCAFKVASTLDYAALLSSTHYPRGSSGKFLTVYPDNDEHFCLLAAELDRATAGLAGPAILSDRPYRAGSLVYYRYGAFAGRRTLTNDGIYQPVLRGADGTLVKDRRDAWFNPPAGVPMPLTEDPPPAAPTTNGKAVAPRQVLLADRFAVREAIRHANRGGVFRALDTRTGADAVIKQARPHVETSRNGWDVRDALRHEAQILDALSPLGIAPRKLELFEQGGHVFLAEELVPGVSLRRWVADSTAGGPGLPWPLAAALIRQLATLTAAVHAAGLALRDFTPHNVLVTPDREVRVVDLELAAPLGPKAMPAGTVGYAAPEQLEGAPVAAEADLYSLGAIGFLLATANDPVFPEDRPPVRSVLTRLEYWLALASEHSEAAKRLTPLILGLMDASPEQRWNLKRVQAFLDAQVQTTAPVPLPVDKPDPGGRQPLKCDQRRLIDDGVEHLLASMTPGESDRLWPSTCFGVETDPCSVYHGAAGVLAVLTSVARWRGDQRLHEALGTACAWIERRMAAEPRVLPGLYFGRSGTAWALYDAARALGDEALAARAVALAKRVPVNWPNPDVTHGAAGAGLTQLHFWQATGDPEFGRRVQRCADGLVAAAEHGPNGTVWPIPASFQSRFAGGTYYGFAHGVAGVAWFLLAAGRATGRDDCMALARAGGETLCAVAERDGDRATWGEGIGSPLTHLVHWCHGSSGVGTLLIRLWQATGEDRYRELAEMAAVAVRHGRWQASPAVCHGLAGNGEFLLDMAAALGEPRYQVWASELAALILARNAYREGRVVVCDDTGTSVAADYGVGLAGVVAFLLRLQDGGPRMWMAEPSPVAEATR